MGLYVQAYAADLAVLVTGAEMIWIRGIAQKTINIAANWALEQQLQFSTKKTKIVAVHLQIKSKFKFLIYEWFKT